MDLETKKAELLKIREQVATCFLCPLSEGRNNAVPGEGNPDAEIMFIGEAPGATEDQKGIPFCGNAGKFLDEMLAGIGLSREDIFITNTVKCRPPGNRDPEEFEKDNCTKDYLSKQIEIIDPKLIVCLGRHAAGYLIPGFEGISKLHGHSLRRPNGKVYLPLYHPAAALHNGGLRSTLIADANKIPAIIDKIKKESDNNINKQELKQEKLI